MTNNSISTVVVGDSEHLQPSLLKRFKAKNKEPRGSKGLGRIAAVIIVVLVLAVVSYIIYKKATNPNITIGKTVIVPSQVKELTDEVAVYTKGTHSSFGKPAEKVAQDDLVLNAALKDQANIHHVTITQADVDATQASQYQQHGSKAGYDQYVQAAGIANLTRIVAENNTYEAKLQGVVIAKKTLFVVGITYDAPYFNNSKDPAALRAQATKLMQTKFLPLFKQGKSEKQIAAQATVNYTQNGPKPDVSIFFTSMPTVAYDVVGCTTAQPCFNDAQVGSFASIPGIVSTETKIDQLTKVGQYTDVFTSKAGFIGILRLSSQTSGAYNSWEQLTQDYEQKYAPQFALTRLIPSSREVGNA